MPTLLLSREDIKTLLGMGQTLDTVEKVYRAHGMEEAVVPTKITLDLAKAGEDGWMNAMPAYVTSTDSAGIKFAGGFINNPEKHNFPYIMATIILNDPKTGQPISIMDGYDITILRTGAAPAVAAKYLKPEVKIVAIIGAGSVGKAVCEAFDILFDLDRIKFYDISRESLEEAQKLLSDKIDVELASTKSCAACVEEAQVVVTATHADEPLFDEKDLIDGAVVMPLGSFRELTPSLVMNASYRIVDHLEQNMHRGEFKTYFEEGELKEEDIYSEIGEIVSGARSKPNLNGGKGIVSLIGVGSLDIALAKYVFKVAKEEEVGVEFNFSGG